MTITSLLPQEPSHLYLVLGVVGGVVLVAAVMMIFLVGLGVYYQHRTRSGNYHAGCLTAYIYNTHTWHVYICNAALCVTIRNILYSGKIG